MNPYFKEIAKCVLGASVQLRAQLRARLFPVRTVPVWPPKKILLLQDAHIGDVLIATSVIPVLRSAFPDVEIGFVVGSWARMVVEGNPEIAHVHVVDHWRANRSQASLWAKWKRYRATRTAALSEVKAVGYDAAICLYALFPDLMDLAWDARIATRVGFAHRWTAGFATACAVQKLSPFAHESERQLELLRALGVEEKHFAARRSMLPESTSDDMREARALLPQDCERYRVIHIGSGARFKEMPIEFWSDVAVQLSAKLSAEHTLLFTGHGERERAMIDAVITGVPRAVNACGRLSWRGFVAAVRNAEMLYGVDSAAGHVAAAVGTPCVVMAAGVDEIGRWRPMSEQVTVFMRMLPCVPCMLPGGCASMECLHQAATPQELVALG